MGDFDFNPKRKDDKGIGKIRLGDETTAGQKEAVAKTATRKKWLIGGGIATGALVVTLGLTAVFNSASHKPAAPVPTTQQTQTYQPPVQPQTPPSERSGVTLAQSYAAKQSAIYRDQIQIYKETDRSGRMVGTGEAYISANGQAVQYGSDFAVHVSLFEKGGISLLVASGPHAGSRVEFMPVGVRSTPRITYSRVGQELATPDGPRFQMLPQAQRTEQTVPMKTPVIAGNGVAMPDQAWEFDKNVRENGETVRAFTVKGNVEEGVFSVKIWNGDTYTINLATGQYTVDSVFLFHPNYLEETQRTGVNIDASTIPLVKGVVQVAPAPRPAPSQVRAPGR
jgi:hypothetical protein